MPDPSVLACFPAPSAPSSTIEHVNDEFTSLCPVTGHPDFGTITFRYVPRERCVELKSLKLYCQSYRNEGVYYEEITATMRNDLAEALDPEWLQVITCWKGRGGIRSRVIAESGTVPTQWACG